MDSEQDDGELTKLLASYVVEDADRELLDRIVAQARKRQACAAPGGHAWLVMVAMLAAFAVLGFWFGSASLPTTSHDVTVASGYMDKVILGPGSFDEVML